MNDRKLISSGSPFEKANGYSRALVMGGTQEQKQRWLSRLASADAPAGRSRWSCSLRLAAPSSSSPSSAPAAPPRARDLPPPPAAERLLCAWGPPAGRPRERVYYCLSPRDRWHDAPPGHGRPVFAATPPLSRCRRSLRAAGPCTGEPGRPAGSSQWAGPQARAGTQSRDMVTAGS